MDNTDSTFERVDSYQVLLADMTSQRDKLYRESNEKRLAADLLTEMCASLRNAIEYETTHYKTIERT